MEDKDGKPIDVALVWAGQEMNAVNVGIVIVAHYNKLIAEGMEEFRAFELTKMFAEVLYRKMWG